MRTRTLLFCLGLSIVAGIPPSVEGQDSDTITVTLRLPAGDPAAGRATFRRMSCTSCHRVVGATDFPDPVSANPGPTLGAYQARQTPSELAMSIYSPSHDITANVRQLGEDKLSPMPDFTNVITVREFIDLIAFIRSLG